MNIKKILCTALAVVGLGATVSVHAQDAANVYVFKGNDYTQLADGEPVLLYNVGTGRFIVNGGGWGVQARLFSANTGRVLTWVAATREFDTHMTTRKDNKVANRLACNVPGYTDANDSGTDANKVFKVIMDGYAGAWTIETQGGYTRTGNGFPWTFVPVEDGDNKTYYMYQTFTGRNYYMGQGYGADQSLPAVDADEAMWTRLNPASDAAFNTQVTILGITTTIRDLYKWRIVKKSELEAVLEASEDAGLGLDVNLTYEIQDNDFSRNDFDFFGAWTANRFTDVEYTTDGEGRHRDMWGTISGTAGTAKKVWNTNVDVYAGDSYMSPANVAGENYLQPVRLKPQWDNKSDAKFGFMAFEGVGTVTSSFTAPVAGSYKIAAHGFYQGHEGYLFATTTNPANLATSDIDNMTALKEVSGYDRRTSEGMKDIGRNLTYNPESYRREVDIVLEAGQTVYFGIGKNEATKSDVDATTGGTTGTRYIVSATRDGHTYYLTHDLLATENEDEAYRWRIRNGYLADEDNLWLYRANTTGATPRFQLSSSTKITNYARFQLVTESGVNRLKSEFSSTNIRYLQISSTGSWTFYDNVSVAGIATWETRTETIAATNYYHDTDFMGVDQFSITFMGKAEVPVMFNEDETSLDYLGTNKEYTNQSVMLHRTFVKDDWNSFVFPLNMSTDQVRYAFGDEVQLAEITELGELSKQPTCIDFKIVPLNPGQLAVTAGKFYLVKPSVNPLINSSGVEYYPLGRNTFNTADFSTIKKETVHVSEAAKEYAEQYHLPTDWLNNVVTTYATYVNGTEIPKGAYVMGKKKDGSSGVQLYRLTRGTAIKGFRGWIEDGTGTTQGASTLSVGGIYNMNTYVDPTTGIEHLRLEKPSTQQGVYDMSGRRISNTLEGLPRGLYIVNGKKMFVK